MVTASAQCCVLKLEKQAGEPVGLTIDDSGAIQTIKDGGVMWHHNLSLTSRLEVGDHIIRVNGCYNPTQFPDMLRTACNLELIYVQQLEELSGAATVTMSATVTEPSGASESLQPPPPPTPPPPPPPPPPPQPPQAPRPVPASIMDLAASTPNVCHSPAPTSYLHVASWPADWGDPNDFMWIPDWKSWRCLLCDMWVCDSHLTGKKHKKALARRLEAVPFAASAQQQLQWPAARSNNDETVVTTKSRFKTEMAPAVTRTGGESASACEVVTVVLPTDCTLSDGYLIATPGDELSVLYKGSTGEEEGWLYAQRLHDSSDQGWIPTANVHFSLAVAPRGAVTNEAEAEIDCNSRDGSPLGPLCNQRTRGEPGPAEFDTSLSTAPPTAVPTSPEEWLRPRAWHEGNLDGASEQQQPSPDLLPGTLLCPSFGAIGTASVAPPPPAVPTSPEEWLRPRAAKVQPWQHEGNLDDVSGQGLSSPTLPLGKICRSFSGVIGIATSQRPPRGQEAQIVTFGVEALDEQLLERCWKWPGGGASIRVSNKELQAALDRSDHEVGNVDLFVDARDFPDPEAMHLVRHTGQHHDIITRICRHRNFPKWLGSVRSRLGAAAAASAARGAAGPAAPLLTIAVYCRSGKHRSVAAALILQHVLRREGYECKDPTHLSETRWSNCCDGQCQECQNPPGELQNTLDKAIKVWRSSVRPRGIGCPCTSNHQQ